MIQPRRFAFQRRHEVQRVDERFVPGVPAPVFYSASGQDIYASGKTNMVAPNTVLDVERYQRDLAALSPGSSALTLTAMLAWIVS